jgi:hypothetical protein
MYFNNAATKLFVAKTALYGLATLLGDAVVVRNFFFKFDSVTLRIV